MLVFLRGTEVDWLERLGYGAEDRRFETMLNQLANKKNCICQTISKRLTFLDQERIEQREKGLRGKDRAEGKGAPLFICYARDTVSL